MYHYLIFQFLWQTGLPPSMPLFTGLQKISSQWYWINPDGTQSPANSTNLPWNATQPQSGTNFWIFDNDRRWRFFWIECSHLEYYFSNIIIGMPVKWMTSCDLTIFFLSVSSYQAACVSFPITGWKNWIIRVISGTCASVTQNGFLITTLCTASQWFLCQYRTYAID